jgi:hypothetical protein
MWFYGCFLLFCIRDGTVPLAELLSSSVVDLIRIGLNADPDPTFYLNVYLDPDPGLGSQAHTVPDPGQTFKLQKIRFFYER